MSDEIPTGPSWIHELKYDGYRLIAQRRDDVYDTWEWNVWRSKWTDWKNRIATMLERNRALPSPMPPFDEARGIELDLSGWPL